MSSAEISALVGQNQMMMTNQMQHAAMISQQAGMQTGGEYLMGRATNVATGIGAPLLQGGMALAGLDPFSAAVRGGMMGFGAGGIAGAAGGAAIGAGAIGLPIMAAQYAGTQMLQGMTQQQELNSMLRQSYGFMGQHGRGFSMGEMGGIGQMLRQQTTMRGPGGEYAGFEELGQLAARMSQMGLGGQNVRNAFEFNEKFKTMLSQVKEIATAFNTTLEQAQQVMGSMRGAGIFRNQGAVAQQVREISMAGGLATSEVTGMMTVGSQLSRMIGGRGQAGAMGGMQTIAQIGMAQQSGLLSDEDLYNLTGLHGAEGRRALATQRMQQSAQFLRGGLGRRMLASMAGPGGTLDEESVEEWRSGGVGTGRTMGMAYRNLGRIGQAGFIRNEGRLRGEVLGRFGGLAPIAAMASWLEQRGMDPGDDRGLIFMSRRLGMSTEEVEQQLREYRQLERMESTRSDRAADSAMRADMERYRQGTGLRGIKKKLEDARNSVQNTLRQAGADFYQSGSEMVERWVNTLTGDFVMTMDRDVGQAIRDASSGVGALSQATAERRFGFGRGLLGQQAGREALSRVGGVTRQITDRAAFEASGDAARYQQAGWTINAGDQRLQGAIAGVRAIQAAGTEGMGEKGAAYRQFGEKNRQELLAMVGMGTVQGGGTEFLRRFGEALNRGSNRELAAEYLRAGVQGQARMAREILGGAGMGGVMDQAMKDPGLGTRFGMGGWRTVGERQEAFADLLKGASRTEREMKWLNERVGGATPGEWAERAGRWGVRAIGGMMAWNPLGLAILGSEAAGLGLGDRAGKWLRGRLEEQMGGLGAGVRRQAAAFAETERGRDLAMNALSREPSTRKAAMEAAMERNSQLLQRAGGQEANLNEIERGEMEFNKSVFVSSSYAALEEKAAARGTPITEAEERQLVDELRRYGVQSIDDARARRDFVTAGVINKQREAFREYAQQRSKVSGEFMKTFRQAGVMQGGRLTAAALGGLTAGGQINVDVTTAAGRGDVARFGITAAEARLGGGRTMSGAALYATRMLEAARLEEEAGAGGTPEQFEAARQARGSAQQILSGMSAQQMREMADQFRGLGAGGVQMGQRIRGIAAVGEKAVRAGRGRDQARFAQQMGQLLGVDLSREELRGLRGKSIEDVASTLVARGGISGDEGAQEEMRKALRLAREGKTAEAGTAIQQLQGRIAEAQREQKYEAAQKDDPAVRKMEEVKQAIMKIGKDGDLKVHVSNAKDIGRPPHPEGGGGGGPDAGAAGGIA